MASALPRLSKSRFCQGLQCPKLLWLRVHEPDAPELKVDPKLQVIFDRGHLVGEAARERFPGGTLIDGEYWQYREKIEKTRRALNDGASCVFEAAFEADGVYVAVDVLLRGKGGFSLLEVKSWSICDSALDRDLRGEDSGEAGHYDVVVKAGAVFELEDDAETAEVDSDEPHLS